MGFPLIDSNIERTESHTLLDNATNKHITLDYRARGRQFLQDGTTYPSSIVVKRGDLVYTEVFSLPIVDSYSFYNEDDALNETSTLYFNSDQSGDVTVTYTTKGSIIKAGYLNVYQQDVPKAIVSGTVADADITTYVFNTGGSNIYGKIIDLSTYTSDATTAAVDVSVGSLGTGTDVPSSAVFYAKSPAELDGVALGTHQIFIGGLNAGSVNEFEYTYTIIIPSTAPDPA